MNLILIAREEIVCLVILIFILVYSRLYRMGKGQENFSAICIYAIGHLVFDLITIITVNRLDYVPPLINFVLHAIFYLFGLLYSGEMLCYTVKRCYSYKIEKSIRISVIVVILLYLTSLPFLKMKYVEGNGTNYSFGIAAILGYCIGIIFFVASIVILLIRIKKLDSHIVYALLPMLVIGVFIEILQAFVPELLFTGGAITIVTVGFFFSLENPIIVLRQKALYDALTGVKSRQSYQLDLANMETKHLSGTQYGVIMCDIDNLKFINDEYGHFEGDKCIGLVANILAKYFTSANSIYRLGGDEFLIVYNEQNIEYITSEIEQVKRGFESESQNQKYKISVAIGSCISQERLTIQESIDIADKIMYRNKKANKESIK